MVVRLQGETPIKEIADGRRAAQRPVSQGHEPIAKIADRNDMKGVTQPAGTAAVIEGGYQMDGIAGVGDEQPAQRIQCRSTREEEDAGARFRAAPVTRKF